MKDQTSKIASSKQEEDLRPDMGVFLPGLIVVLLITLPAVIAPKWTEDLLTSIYVPFARDFGTTYLWITVGLIALCVYFAASRWGDIKFGEPDEKPQFKLTSWVAMIFCSGVGGAIMFWAITEPLWDIMIPPQNAEPMSIQAYDWSLAYLLLHWGPNAWCTYLITALPIAYMLYIKKEPFLRISMASEMILGPRLARGLFGRCLDTFFILGLMFCTAVTMCLSLPTVTQSLHAVFGIDPGLGTQLYVLLFSGLVSAVTVYKGLDRGIKWLSDVNVIIALFLAAYCFLCGPTVTLFNIFTNAFGKLLGNYPNMVFWTDPWAGGSFPRDWTIFYALFWAGFGPFMGLFIARISRGRTIREIIGWGMVGTVAGGCLMHGIFGSYSLYVQHSGIIDAVAILKEQGGAAAMIAVLGTLPLREMVLIVYCILSTIFLATTVNAGSYVVATAATKRISPDSEPHRVHRTFWCVAQCLLAFGLLSMGGLGVAKMFGNFSGALMVLPVLLLVACWFRILSEKGAYMLRHHVVALPVDDVSPADEKNAEETA
ncbi:MAG: BCCT family transporter [Desulfovibrionaceae bacterium]|nr:BCCT family transporter [Desulfovibrionaceae bacterium]